MPPDAPSPPPRSCRFSLKYLLALPTVVAVFFGLASLGGFAWAGWITFFSAGVLILLRQRRHACGCVSVAVVLLVGLFGLAVTNMTKPFSYTSACMVNLKLISLALSAYEMRFGCLPPAHVVDKQGRPMHSWRVLILPELGEANLYAQYRFDEPWDGPHNRLLASRMPQVYACPGRGGPSSMTSYVAVVGPQTAWPGDRPLRLAEITDDPARTLLIVETADGSIPWMAPRDLEMGKFPLQVNPPDGRGISAWHPPPSRFPLRKPQIVYVVTADGGLHSLYNDTPAEVLDALLTRNGNEDVPADAAW